MHMGYMEDTNDDVHESLQRLYELAHEAFKVKRSPTELARLLEESAQTIHNWSKGRGVSKQGAAKCQRLYGWSAIWIREGLEPRYIGGDDWSPGVGRIAGIQNRRITVLGEITSTDGGELQVHDFSSDSERRQVIAVTGGVPSHGLIVATDLLQPRYRLGEILIVADNLEAEPGSDVLVFCVDGRALVKQFAYRRGDLVTLNGLGGDDHKHVTLGMSVIMTMAPILSHCGVQVSQPAAA